MIAPYTLIGDPIGSQANDGAFSGSEMSNSIGESSVGEYSGHCCGGCGTSAYRLTLLYHIQASGLSRDATQVSASSCQCFGTSRLRFPILRLNCKLPGTKSGKLRKFDFIRVWTRNIFFQTHSLRNELFHPSGTVPPYSHLALYEPSSLPARYVTYLITSGVPRSFHLIDLLVITFSLNTTPQKLLSSILDRRPSYPRSIRLFKGVVLRKRGKESDQIDKNGEMINQGPGHAFWDSDSDVIIVQSQ